MCEFALVPLFSSLVSTVVIENKNFTIFDYVKNKCKYLSASDYGNEGTEDVYLLDKFPEEKDYIMEKFNIFKDEVLEYRNTNFYITTSWATKLKKDTHIPLHRHRNSFYSGVLYLDDVEESDGGMIEFVNVNQYDIQANTPQEWNYWNANSWHIQPRKNLLVFFPSNLYHKTSNYVSDSPRYSISFNIFMEGEFGNMDSTLKVTKF